MNKVEICGVNTAKLPLLTHEEKTQLLQRIKQGDQEARRIFIEGNLAISNKITHTFILLRYIHTARSLHSRYCFKNKDIASTIKKKTLYTSLFMVVV